MKIVFIKPYERISLSRWGWHTFRELNKQTGQYTGRIIGFRFLGVGLTLVTDSRHLPFVGQ